MKNYKKIEISEIQATQYGEDETANQYIERCVFNNKGEIASVNNGLLGIPKDPFTGVKTAKGYKRIAKGDWIVKKGDEILVVPNDIFQLMFIEV